MPSESVYCVECAEVIRRNTTEIRLGHLGRDLMWAGVPQILKDAEYGPTIKARIAGHEGDNLIIAGPPGVGKSWMAAAIAKEALRFYAQVVPPNDLDYWKYVCYRRAEMIMLALRAAYTSDYSEEQALSRFIKPLLLVIDDLGSEKTSEWTDQMWLSLLDARMAKNHRTVITTNLKTEELKNKYGEAFYDRIKAFHPVRILGKSRRSSPDRGGAREPVRREE